MPLFNRRSRSVSTSRPMQPASSSSAHLAATQAFLASQPSQSNLSASAAAAALRTMSPAPVPVDQVQTKRMLNRQTSNSSITSAQRGRSRGGPVQRKSSVSSMTERTFRSPSPAQQSPRAGPVTGYSGRVPPVPSVPYTYTDDLPPVTTRTHRRSASMEAPPPRVSSPPLSRPSGRGQGVNQSPVVSSAATAAARQSVKPQPVSQRQRSDSQDSRNSINFSYPRGSRPNSPPPRSPLASSNDGLPSESPKDGITAAEAARIQNQLLQTAAQPVKKKKKRVDPSMIEGSHLQSGTMGAKPVVTPLEPLPADYEAPTNVEPVKKAKKKAALTGQNTHFPDSHELANNDPVTSHGTQYEDQPDRKSQRAAGALGKQPSVVREDWEGERGEVESQAHQATFREPMIEQVHSKKATPEANMSRKIEDPPSAVKPLGTIHSAVTTGPSTAGNTGIKLLPAASGPPAGRAVSISPSRSTRFSDRLASDLAAGRKHEPLGRSVSPAKSALKQSGGMEYSPTDPRFPGRRGSSVTPSETSDVSDGISSRRKSSRVSFDNPPDAKDSLADMRSSADSHKKSWLGIGKGKSSNLGTASNEDDYEEGMKPRPALPSFGSVRRGDRSTSPSGRKTTAAELQPDKSNTASSSETSSIVDPPTLDTSISSDHALGGLLSREGLKNGNTSAKPRGNEPTLSSAVSEEGVGYASDTDSVYSDNDRPFRAAQTASQQLEKSLGTDEYAAAYRDEIPVIAVQPATPGLDELHRGEDWAMEVPGGFPVSGAASTNSSQGSNENLATTPVKNIAGLGLADPSDDFSSPARDNSPSSSPQQLMTIAEEDSDADSVYSDAAEDLSYLEGDGFGSINAIMESPVVAVPQQRIRSSDESLLAATPEKRPTAPETTDSWNDTQAHWSGLAQHTRSVQQQSSNTRLATSDADRDTDNVVATPTKVKTQAPTKVVQAPKPSISATNTPHAAQSNPQDTNRARGQPVASTVVATKTSRTKPQNNFRSSMRDQSDPVAPPAKQRPVSYVAPTAAPRAALQKKFIPPTAASPAATPKGLSRRFSNDSDSDSSFKKARRNRKSADNTYSMRRSMRSGPTEPERPTIPTDRSGVRSMSPPINRRPTSPMGVKTMRSTMRGSVELGTPTLRGQPERKRSSSLFSRNRDAKSPTRSFGITPAMPTKLKSRLADSDDEDEPRPSRFRSRFADSSDEDEPKTFRPVRGIPKKKDAGDSTDLDDSSDDQRRRSKPAAAKKLTIVPPSPSQEIVSPPLSPNSAKKRGLWSRIRGKKTDEGESSVIQPTIAERQGIKENIEANKHEMSNAKQLGFNSTAERDALIEQTRLKLEAAREGTTSQLDLPSSPGKLQRRVTPQRVFSDSWATPKLTAPVDERPQTSGGVDGGDRPAIGSRQPTSEVVNGDRVVLGKSGKKKKFGFLRRAFGLND